MKIARFTVLAALLALLFAHTGYGQAFRKGSLFISISEGATHANYSTQGDGGGITKDHINGDRDPLTIEYGLSKKWGVGVNLGTDIFKVNTESFYGFQTTTGIATAYMSEFTLDGHYHYYVTKHSDLSAFASVGFSSVYFEGRDRKGDNASPDYKYNAGGGIIRIGARGKYYFKSRFGVIGMVSLFSASCKPKDIGENAAGQTYRTKIKGSAIEFGLCYRFLKGK